MAKAENKKKQEKDAAVETGSGEDLNEAAVIHEDKIKTEPLNENAYKRLMIIYRKLKRYKDELRVIKTGIATFEKHYKKKVSKKKVVELSNALMKKTGLQDKKGKNVYSPEPIGTWLKRKDIVEKKLKK